jgi:uncharacterized protein (DUF1501 family)
MSHTRREFLKVSLGTAALGWAGANVPGWLSCPALGAATTRGSVRPASGYRDAGETILVVLQLAGGNDGLNTVVPYDNDDYARNRPTLRQPADKVHKINSRLGLHPQMQAMMRLYKEGHLSILQGIGYPRPSGDHAVAMQDWQTGKPHQTNCQTGWLGRAVDNACGQGQADMPAVFVGQIPRPFTLNAVQAVVPWIRSLQDCTLHAMPGLAGGQSHEQHLVELAQLPWEGQKRPTLDFLRCSTLEAYAGSGRVEAVARAETSAATAPYPPFQLAQMLKIVAQLIRAELGIRIYCTELGGNEPGGFDTHANQRDNHGALLRQLSESVAAFVDDLERDKLLDRVLLMTFSEFGRTVKENGRRGTDHGSAAPLFLAGGKVKGGLIGAYPNLTDLENGGQKFHTDFRRVYATVLDRWLGFDSKSVLGEEFEPLDVLRA